LQALQNYQLRAEWADRYDAAIADLNQVKGTQPTLSPMTAVQIERAIPVYQQIVARGGWPTLPEKIRLKLGSRDRAVATLRERLVISGDLVESGGRTDTFDSYVDAAVRRFQVRHGLHPGRHPSAADHAGHRAERAGRPARLRQLEAQPRSGCGLDVRLPRRALRDGQHPGSAEIEAVEKGDVVRSRHTAVVGKIDRQTPILSAKIHEVNFNPYWHRAGVDHPQGSDPEDAGRTRSTSCQEQASASTTARATSWQATDIDWNTDQATQYQFRQEPGLRSTRWAR
jgi:murein L,D-transpeptidase YcbB/YkuD